MFGLEGPVYVMGRMFDDPEHHSAKELLTKFCDAAFGKAAPAMRSFYDQLYHAITLYTSARAATPGVISRSTAANAKP